MSHQSPSRRRRSMLLGAAAAAALPSLALSQGKYPSRPIEFIVPWGAGGGADQMARRVGKLLEPELGVSVPILNVPGATGNTGAAKLASAPADGHTIAVFIGDTLGTLAGGAGRWKLSDIAPLGVMIRQPTGLFVKQDAKWKTFDELLAEARTREIKAGITGFGSADEMLLLQMNQKGFKFRPVPFAAPGERYASVLGGHADVVVEQAGDVRSFLDGKQMRPIVFFSDAPQAGYPDTALAKAHGFPLVISQFRAVLARAGTSPAHLATLSAALDRVAQRAEFRKYLEDELAFPDSYIPAAQAGAFFERELKLLEANQPKKP